MGKNLTPTDEQQAIIDACYRGEPVKVTALAGTGKTTTMQLAAEAMPHKKGLYLAFNKSVQVEAEGRFPATVKAKTAHSLAYGSVGKKFRHRLNGPRIRAADLAARFTVKGFGLGDRELPPALIAALAQSAVRRFTHSAAPVIEDGHIPYLEGLNTEADQALRAHVLPFAEDMWADLQDPDSDRAKFEHDTYLKMWALKRPKLKYDYIVMDEAQDANPVLLDLLKQQTETQTILIGDPNQAIYAWRGAVDGLSRWKAATSLSLTESWRFGPEVAAEANKWLSIPELHCKLQLVGNGPGARVGPVVRPDAILCRTNAGAVSEALDALDAGRRTAIVGGGVQIRDMSYAAIDLMARKPTTHPELAAFGSWDEVQEYVNNEDGAEDLAVFVRLVDKHGPMVLIDAVDQLVDEGRGRPEVTISTAHKAKGLEYASVRIGQDYREPGIDDEGNLKRLDKSEAMLCYVAVTRAKRELDATSVAWIDDYLAGRPSALQLARWEARKHKADQEIREQFAGALAPAIRELVEEEREWRQ